MKALVIVLLTGFFLIGCMDIVAIEAGRKQIAREYPECANLSPGETLNCKQAVDRANGKEVKERVNLGSGIQPVK